MSVLCVVSDQPGVGKTALCAALASRLGGRGASVNVLKPFASGEADADGDRFGRLLDQSVEGWPRQVTESGIDDDALEDIAGAIDSISGGEGVTVVEVTNALSAEDAASLVRGLSARAVLVSDYRRDLTAAELSPWTEALGESLLGVVVNGLTQYLGTEARENLLPTFEAQGVECLGIIPESRNLLALTAAQIAEHLNGSFITDSPDTDRLIERFQVGGLSLDPGELRFGLYPNNAVVIRGDRPDVQMSALNVPASCLVLTAGIEPIEYVQYEAQEENVPVVLVPDDTATTMANLNTLQNRAAFDHPQKLETFVELIEGHLDLDAIDGAMAT